MPTERLALDRQDSGTSSVIIRRRYSLLLGHSYLLKVQKSWLASKLPSFLALAINWLVVLE
jgi:hypothetical protein